MIFDHGLVCNYGWPCIGDDGAVAGEKEAKLTKRWRSGKARSWRKDDEAQKLEADEKIAKRWRFGKACDDKANEKAKDEANDEANDEAKDEAQDEAKRRFLDYIAGVDPVDRKFCQLDNTINMSNMSYVK